MIIPRPLGSIVDDVNRQQEITAELAKFIIYQHEFEMNLNEEFQVPASEDKIERFEYRPEDRPRGLRLTPDGQDHVRQIARALQQGMGAGQAFVIVERSRSTKRWDTEHRFPVHFNDELDLLRRDVVVTSLKMLGIQEADDLVMIAPAYPNGLNAVEAARAYSRAINSGDGGADNSGGRGFGGGVF